MKKSIVILAAVALFIMGTALSVRAEDQVNWQAFSENLTVALRSDNEGLRHSALCMIVQYGDQLDLKRDVIFDIVRTFRSDDDPNVRLLAMVALYKTEDVWAMDFLKRQRRFEKDERIQRVCCSAVKAYYAKMDSLRHVEESVLVKNIDRIIKEQHETAAAMLNIQQYGL